MTGSARDNGATTPAGSTASRDLLRFDRSDRIALTVLLALLGLAAVGAWLVAPVWAWIEGAALHTPYSAPVEVPSLQDAGVGHTDASFDLVVHDPSVGQRLLDLLPGLGFLVVAVAAGLLVLALMRDISRGDPFAPRNVTRLRALALLVAVGWTLVSLAGTVVDSVIVAGLDSVPDRGVQIGIPVLPVLVGVIVALVAEAFKAGSRLRDDVNGLV